MRKLLCASLALAAISGIASTACAEEPFAIHVVDDATGRPVPLVELETVNHLRFVTDNAGVVAFDEPGLMNRGVFFTVKSHGYEFKADGFGFHGRKLQISPGGKETLKVKRLNIAERLYRITGAGQYAESFRLGIPAPIDKPLLNADVLGSDSVHNAIYKGKLFWLWGDTNRPGYPLGNFQVTCAKSDLPDEGGLDPEVGVNLRYFENEDGFTRQMAPISGKGPTWLGGLTTLPDAEGRDHLVAFYVKVEPPLKVYEKGLCEFNPKTETFERLLVFDDDHKLVPDGHPFLHQVDGKTMAYFGSAVPKMRIPANYESWKNPDSYQAVEPDVKFTDADSGKSVQHHNGSIEWNPWRKKWISIFTESGGESSYLGEIWYAESDTPEGPWRKAIKIVTHDHYSFYNPKQHPYFSKEGGRVIYFEGTYTAMFSKAPVKTPRYDYNQILYRLDLDDARLKPSH